MEGVSTIILGAGLGKRMRSGLAKVLHPVAGVPMILYPVEVAKQVSSERIIVVAGFQADKVKSILPSDVEIVHQPGPKGTADAVKLAFDALGDYRGRVIVLCGDVPLITKETVVDLISSHQRKGASITVLTTEVDDPGGYGRILRNANGDIVRIVEDADADENIKSIREINTGIYVFETGFFKSILEEITPENMQKEFYLTDTIEIGRERGIRVYAYRTERVSDVIGVNTRVDLAYAETIMKKRINERHMLNGVTMIDPEATYIERDVVIGKDVVIYPGVVLQGHSVIGETTVIYSHSRIINSRIGRGVIIRDSSIIEDSIIEDGVQIGPFARLRPGTKVDRNARIGNFVELKKVTLGEGSKANHLTYLGDAEIGRDVNIGAGTITCNYDGWVKHKTAIGDRVFIGSDVQIVAPVKIGDDTFVAAGTTVTRDVPSGALAISRTEQKNKEGWVEKRRKKKNRDKK